MALVVRYFSTSSAGAGDGTSWADRAALFSSGNWSTVITGFDFSGSDALECRIEGGITYTCSQSLASGLFANAPTAANPLILHGCDSSGNKLSPPDPDWVSAQPEWDDSTLPVIATTTNINTINLATCALRLVKFTASGCNGAVVASSLLVNWCSVLNSTSNTAAVALISPTTPISNTVASCTGSSYSAVISSSANGPHTLTNVRVSSVAGSSGNRRGVSLAAFGPTLHADRLAIVGVGGEGIYISGQAASSLIRRSVIAGAGGDGIEIVRSTSGSKDCCAGLMVTGCGGYGIVCTTTSGAWVVNSRLRDNTSGNFGTFGNYPTDLDNYTTDSDDATEYVNAAGGDYRIKYGSAIWGQGYGAGDEPAPAGGGGRQPRLVTMS